MVGLYLLGGIAGGLLYLLSYNLFPYFDGKEGLMCGASASIIAIVVATAFRMPDYKVNLLFSRSYIFEIHCSGYYHH